METCWIANIVEDIEKIKDLANYNLKEKLSKLKQKNWKQKKHALKIKNQKINLIEFHLRYF